MIASHGRSTTRRLRVGVWAGLALCFLGFGPGVRAQQQFVGGGSVPKPLTGGECPAADVGAEDPTYRIRQQAFDTDKAGDHEAARHLMRCAIRANPHDVVALKQEVYYDLNAKDEQAAREDIDAIRAYGASSASFEAQQGYIFAKAGDIDEARLAFGRAIAFGDAAVTAQAMQAIRVLDGLYPRHVLAVAVDSQYLNRFDDGVVDTSARYLERLGSHSPFQVYAGARLLRDTASNGGTLPQIFSDNAFLTGVGVQFQPRNSPVFVMAEANEAYVFYGSKTGGGALVPDDRVTVGYYRLFRSRAMDTFDASRISYELNGSFGFYSRYQHNGIAYLQPREMVELTPHGSALQLTPFLQESVALDTNRAFYNNVLELIPGFEVSDTKAKGLALRVEYVRGFYLPADAGNPYGSSYNDFRVRLVFQKSIPFATGAR